MTCIVVMIIGCGIGLYPSENTCTSTVKEKKKSVGFISPITILVERF